MPTNAEWWLDWAARIIVPVLFGGLAGGFIGAQLTTRRERWNLRRDLYFDLMKDLVEFNYRIRELHQVQSELGKLTQPGVATLTGVDLKLASLLIDLVQTRLVTVNEAWLRVTRALAVARILIPASVVHALDEIAGERVIAARDEGAEPLGPRIQKILDDASRDLEVAARTDLLGMSGWVPAESLHRHTHDEGGRSQR